MPWLRKKIKHPTAPKLYQFRQGIQVMADSALLSGFEQPTYNPIYLVRGAGKIAGSLMVLQPPVSFAPLAVPIASFGGTQAGIFQLQPLVDTTGDPNLVS